MSDKKVDKSVQAKETITNFIAFDYLFLFKVHNLLIWLFAVVKSNEIP